MLDVGSSRCVRTRCARRAAALGTAAGGERPLAVAQHLDAHDKLRQADERARIIDTVKNARVPLLLKTSDICRTARPLVALLYPEREGPDITPPHASSRRAGDLVDDVEHLQGAASGNGVELEFIAQSTLRRHRGHRADLHAEPTSAMPPTA
jgi:hypothetical protein